ncbi:MAG: M42 family metallopeptidase [Thermoplasmata archaeon]
MKELKGIDEFEKLIKASGVSGYEDEICETIRTMVSDLGETRVDNIGNLILEFPGEGPHIAIVAHMDEVGMVVSNIEDNGFLRVMKIGGVKDSLLLGRHVTIHTSEGPVNGVIGHKAPHLTTDQDKRDEIVPWTSTYVDVGAGSSEEVRELGIDVPDSITFMKTLRPLRGKILAGRAMDNRIGCYALIQLARKLKDTGKHLTLVWSVQEEIGLRGAKVVGNMLKPDYVIALDTYTTSDSPGLKSFYKPIKLGKGPVLRMVDVRAISSPKLVRHFKKVAEDNGIPVQYGVTGGTTDGMALQEFGPLTMAIGVPVRYSHSTVEVAHWDDVTGLSPLLEAGIRELND